MWKFHHFQKSHTLSDKISSDKIFVGQNFSSDKIFDTFPKIRHFRPMKIIVQRNFVRNLLYRNSFFYHITKMSLLKSTLDRSFNPLQYEGVTQQGEGWQIPAFKMVILLSSKFYSERYPDTRNLFWTSESYQFH